MKRIKCVKADLNKFKPLKADINSDGRIKSKSKATVIFINKIIYFLILFYILYFWRTHHFPTTTCLASRIINTTFSLTNFYVTDWNKWFKNLWQSFSLNNENECFVTWIIFQQREPFRVWWIMRTQSNVPTLNGNERKMFFSQRLNSSKLLTSDQQSSRRVTQQKSIRKQFALSMESAMMKCLIK